MTPSPEDFKLVVSANSHRIHAKKREVSYGYRFTFGGPTPMCEIGLLILGQFLFRKVFAKQQVGGPRSVTHL